MTKQLTQLFINHLIDSDQIEPQYIGEFDGIESLPKGVYPTVYYWGDTQLKGGIRLSFNTPLLKRICTEQARISGISVDEQAVNDVVAMFQGISEKSFSNTVLKMAENLGST